MRKTAPMLSRSARPYSEGQGRVSTTICVWCACVCPQAFLCHTISAFIHYWQDALACVCVHSYSKCLGVIPILIPFCLHSMVSFCPHACRQGIEESHSSGPCTCRLPRIEYRLVVFRSLLTLLRAYIAGYKLISLLEYRG